MLEKLPWEVKDLVVRGVYSLFELTEPTDDFSYILIKSDDSALLLNRAGSKVKSISDITDYQLGKIVMINDIDIPDSVVVNNVI